MRKREFHPSQDDPDRTDELPQLDPAAYEAHLKAMESNGLDNTDTWLAPQPQDLHGARIEQLEGELKDREAELHALQGTLEVAASSNTRLGGDLNGVLDRIAQLEARLDEAGAANTSLEAVATEVSQERDVLKARCAKLEVDLAALASDNDTQQSLIVDLEQTLEAERLAAESRFIEARDRATESLATATAAQSDASALRLQLDLTRADLDAARARTAELEPLLAEQTGAAAMIAKQFAEQYSRSGQLQAALDTTHAAVANLERVLAMRDHSIAELEDAAAAATAQIARLDTDITSRDESLAALRQTLQAGDGRIVELHDQIATHQASVVALGAENRALQQSLESREQALLESARLHEQEVAAAASLTHELELLREELASKAAANDEALAQLADSRASLAEAASERDAALHQVATLQAGLESLQTAHAEAISTTARQSDQVAGLESRLAECEALLSTQGNELQARDERAQALETDAVELQTRSAALSRQLEEAHSQSKSLAAELHAREEAVSALRTELATHVDALAAIRRDITRIESGQVVDAARVPLRYLIGVDNTDIVHVLNRKVMTIGRTHENDLQIRSSHISRHHARLLIGASAVIIEDLGSTNGCYVNGRRVRKQVLQNEDVLMIGKTRYRFSARPQGEPAAH